MKKTVLGFLFVVSTVVSYACTIEDSKVHTFHVGEQKYEVIKVQKTWVEAAACAVVRGGYLTEIQSQNENDAIVAGVQAAGVANSYVQVPDGGGAAYIWIGATDRAEEGKWLWNGKNESDSGTLFYSDAAVGGAYINWGQSSFGNEPDNFQSFQDVGAIALSNWPKGAPGQWNDINEGNQLYFVIEYPDSTGGASPDSTEGTSLQSQVEVPSSLKAFWIQHQKQLGTSFKARIYDVNGDLVAQLSTYQEFQSHPLSAGKYFVRFTGFSEAFSVWIP